MKVKKVETNVILSLFVLAGLIGAFSLAIAGDLEPSAPPGPTMKTLDEVEPRIPIHKSDLPLTINVPGSYYLVEDANSPPTAITVNADNVTIDLMGYSLIGPGKTSGTNYGIFMSGRKNVEIRNGTIRRFSTYGIYENNSSGNGHRVIDVRVFSNGDSGIWLEGSSHLIRGCAATDNYIGIGINGGIGCTITNNTVYANSFHGIWGTSRSNVTSNTVYTNGGSGISIGPGCTVTGNTVYANGLSSIWGSSGSTLTGNTVNANNQSDVTSYAGILVIDDCLVKCNSLNANKQNNIYVKGSGNAIEENLVTDSPGNGINFISVGNFYANNRASGNGTDYSVAAGNTNGGGNASF